MADIYSATKEEIINDAYLYNKCISLLKQVGYKVYCNCGNVKKSMNVETFINNKTNIMESIVKIENRTIFPKWNGVLYSSRAMKHFNAKSMTDEKIIELVNSGMLSKDLFDWSKYKGEVKEEKKEEFPDEYKEENIQEELSFDTNDNEVKVDSENNEVKVDSENNDVKVDVMTVINSLKEEGKSNGEIAKTLNEMGYKTDKGKDFYAVNVTKLLNK